RLGLLVIPREAIWRASTDFCLKMRTRWSCQEPFDFPRLAFRIRAHIIWKSFLLNSGLKPRPQPGPAQEEDAAMLDPEFQVQILDTPQQWKSGLPVRLNVDANGLSLFTTPSFESWLDRSAAGGDIVTDECGQTWWIALDSAT